MHGIEWTKEHLDYLISNYEKMSCYEIGKELGRTTKSVQHKFNQLGLERRKANIGDIVNGWEIIDIFSTNNGSQNIKMAKIKSTLEDKIEKNIKLTLLTNNQIGWPDRRRPDIVEKNYIHGLSKSRLYSIWVGMKNRCLNPKQLSYKDYGGRGIKIYDDWLEFDKFREWSQSNGYEESLTLDRINVDGNYCPENCRWSDWATQCENKRCNNKLDITAFGETKSIYKWAKDSRCSVTHTTIRYRIGAGWNPEEAISHPSERSSKQDPLKWLKTNHPDIYQQYLLS